MRPAKESNRTGEKMVDKKISSQEKIYVKSNDD